MQVADFTLLLGSRNLERLAAFYERILELERLPSKHHVVFRIGGASNRGWSSRLLYRVDADAMASPDALFSPEALTRYRRRSLWNRLRWR